MIRVENKEGVKKSSCQKCMFMKIVDGVKVRAEYEG